MISILYIKLNSKFGSWVQNLKLRFNRSLIIQRGVKVDSDTKLEEHVKIYSFSKVLGSSIGCGSYIGWNAVLNRVKIGRFCSVAPFVEVIYGRHAVDEFVSSHPAFYSTKMQSGFSFVDKAKYEEITYADREKRFQVVIGNDVWIGYGAKVLEGIVIGDGAIIGAGALVTKDVEPYAIYGGVPAKKIKDRFDPEVVDALIRTKWWDKEFDWIKLHADLFDNPHALVNVLLKDD